MAKKFIDVMGVKKGAVNYTVPEGKKNAGKTRVLLTPAGKRAKFKAELDSGYAMTYDGQVKKEKNGDSNHLLTPGQIAYRKGFLKAQDEARAIYAKKHKKN